MTKKEFDDIIAMEAIKYITSEGHITITGVMAAARKAIEIYELNKNHILNDDSPICNVCGGNGTIINSRHEHVDCKMCNGEGYL